MKNKLWFGSDYQEFACDEILNAFKEAQYTHNSGYGTDVYCNSAAEKIRKACNCEDAEIFFLTGGTQTNQVVIDTMLKPWEGVIAASTGHVNCHEAGAIEFTGHKVIELPEHDAKVNAEEVRKYCENFYSDVNHEHMVAPGMIYISWPTESGTLYTKEELKELRKVCDDYHMSLYLDGARLAYGLAAETTVTLADIAALTDVFYIGGTKCGALYGEAVVFTKHNMPDHFITRIKQHGALLAKGFGAGIQFDTLFTDHLYERLGKHAIDMAMRLKNALKDKGYQFYIASPTNQQFIILDNKTLKKLDEQIVYGYWCPMDKEHTVIRLATSWATSQNDVDALIKIL